MNLRCFARWIAVALIACPAVYADIVVTPPEPLSAQEVTIELSQSYGSEAFIVSNSVEVTGNTILIFQTVELICPLPNAPTLRSEFTVGPLAAGEYDIIAEIEHISILPNCGAPNIIQTASFSVIGVAVDIPTLSPAGLAAIVALLGLVAVRRLRGRTRGPDVYTDQTHL